jgi:hypothetical protein
MTTSNLTYDLIFHDDETSNAKGWNESLEYCKNYIQMYNGTNESYFSDYVGGHVTVTCNETGENVHYALVKPF